MPTWSQGILASPCLLYLSIFDPPPPPSPPTFCIGKHTIFIGGPPSPPPPPPPPLRANILFEWSL